MARSLGRDENVIDSVIDLENAAKTPAKQRAIKISSTVDLVCIEAYQNGLQSASLNKLIDLITLPNEVDQASLSNLIKNLYPASKVPEVIVVKVVGSLGHGRAKPSYSTQAALLKWLVMVYDVLKDHMILSRLYNILFNLLDTIAIRYAWHSRLKVFTDAPLRPQLCHLLSLITRRKHVRPFRIQWLMELTRQAGNEPPLVGLMRVYKDYYPDVIVGNATLGRASVFKHPNQEWRQRLGEIQDVYFQKTQDGFLPGQKAFHVNRRDGSKSSLLPQVQTSNAQESSTTLEEIENLNDFVRKLEKIELPNQLVAAVGDSLLQKFLQLKTSESTLRRIDNWLLAFFEDQLETPGSEAVILEMLAAIRDYTQYTKVLPPACLTYLKSMMDSWNGSTGRESILGLLTYIPMRSFDSLYEDVFRPLEEAVLAGDDIDSKLSLLAFYKSLLQQWTTSLLSQSPVPVSNTSATSDLVTHVNNLALTIMQCSSSVLSSSAVLDFYETAAVLISHPSLRAVTRITTPPAELVYTLYFTCSSSTLSRLCAILAQYKRAFEFAVASKADFPASEMHSYPKEDVSRFNGFLMDICNCIWRSRAFNSSDTNALGCLIPDPLNAALAKYVASLDTSISLQALFGLSYSPVLCLLAISYIRETEDKEGDTIIVRHAGPVTQASLKQLDKDGGLSLPWADYRMGVLRYLETKGASGVGELMYNTMKHLMTARQNMA